MLHRESMAIPDSALLRRHRPLLRQTGAGVSTLEDTASKLIVNRPNGNTWLTLTGIMRGLAPRTTYTVYISNGYAPYVQTGWDVSGNLRQPAAS
jgi:hypothetical protein